MIVEQDKSLQEEIAFIQEEKMNVKDDTYKILEWYVENPDIKKLFATPLDMNAEACLDIIELLEANGFYESILIFLINCRYIISVNEAIEKLAIESLTKELKKIGSKQMCQKIKAKIKYEMELKRA